MLVSDSVFKKVYEAFERHDSCVTIVPTKSMDALSTICAVAAANATCAIYINSFEFQRVLNVTRCIPQYAYGLPQLQQYIAECRKKRAEIIDRCKASNTYDTVLAIHDELTKGVRYQENGKLSHSIVGPLLFGRGVCDGFSKTLKYIFIQIIGGNASGKTAFSAAFQHQYLRLAQGHGGYKISGEPKEVFDALEGMYTNGVTDPSSPSEVSSYNYVHHLKGAAAHSLIFYDIPDEVLLSEEYEKSPLNFGYTDGIIIIIDPLSVASLRNECVRQGDISASSDFSNDDSEAIIVDFINKFSEIAGRSARKMSDIPVAVLIAKSDIKRIKSSIGMPKIKSQFKKDPEKYNGDLSAARDEICRSFLNDIGLANVVNNLESVFLDVCYFPISALGHPPKVGVTFEPFGVIEPVTWIAKKQQSAVYPL